MEQHALWFRSEALPRDIATVREILEETNMFTPEEVAVGVELVAERVQRGESSGYYFLFAESPEGTLGYACYGPIACTIARFDLFWIAVRPGAQGRGLGAAILAETERCVSAMGGARVYIETSSKARYLPTRRFYLSRGYDAVAELEDFYSDTDNKVIFLKRLQPAPFGPAIPEAFREHLPLAN